MTSYPLAITGSGMVSAVGLSAPSSCAGIRCAVDNFQETQFVDSGGEWIIGSSVELGQPWCGGAKLVKMLASVLAECIACAPSITLDKVPILLCVAEEERPGRFPGLERVLLDGVQQELGLACHPRSRVFAKGHVGAAYALLEARNILYGEWVPNAIVAGVDSLLVGRTLQAYEESERLLTTRNSNGFIPGEAAAAVLVGKPMDGQPPSLLCTGIGCGEEKATVVSEGEALRGNGLVAAIRGAASDSGRALDTADFVIADLSGEQYHFKEAALALFRTLRQRKEVFDVWHPADCIGEVGAAIGPVMLAVLLAAFRKGYNVGPTALGHLGNDDGARAAMFLQSSATR